MSRQFATPQFIPQSPISRRFRAMREEEQQYQQHDDDDGDETNTTTIRGTPRRGQSTTRAGGLKTPYIPRTNITNTNTTTPSLNSTSTTVLPRSYNQNNTIIGADVTMVGNHAHVESINYSTSPIETYRDLYFKQAAIIDAQWAAEKQ